MLGSNPDTLELSLWAGEPGTRLYRSPNSAPEPAVPLAGYYRLIDIPINASSLRHQRIFVLTQFSTVSLHRH